MSDDKAQIEINKEDKRICEDRVRERIEQDRAEIARLRGLLNAARQGLRDAGEGLERTRPARHLL